MSGRVIASDSSRIDVSIAPCLLKGKKNQYETAGGRQSDQETRWRLSAYLKNMNSPVMSFNPPEYHYHQLLIIEPIGSLLLFHSYHGFPSEHRCLHLGYMPHLGKHLPISTIVSGQLYTSGLVRYIIGHTLDPGPEMANLGIHNHHYHWLSN